MMKKSIRAICLAAVSILVVFNTVCVVGEEEEKVYYPYVPEDADGDGHYALSSSKVPNDDCDDFNSNVYPGAFDYCDITDNDCDLVLDEDCALYSPLMRIPAGCFDMGDAFSEGDPDELPVHQVCFTSDFYMDVHETTNAEYKMCVEVGACTAPSNTSSYNRASYYGNPAYDDFPVIFVNWSQAAAFCAWACKRLPTEAEWEYAARGGLEGKRFPWGDTITATDANYMNSGDPWETETSQVEYYPPNGYGLYDMAGNVNEWVNDWYAAGYYSVSPIDDPAGPASGTELVTRDSDFSWFSQYLRTAERRAHIPTWSGYLTGFRCAADP